MRRGRNLLFPERMTDDPALYLTLHRWKVIAVASVIAVTGMLVGSMLQPQYESAVRVILEPIQVEEGEAGFSSETLELDLDTQAGVARSLDVERIAAEILGHDATVGGLTSSLGVTPVPTTNFLRFSYTHSDPEVARVRVEAFAEAYLEFRRRVLVGDALTQAESLQSTLDVVEEELRGALSSLASTDDPARRAALTSFAEVLEGTATQIEVDLAELAEIQPVGSIAGPASAASFPTRPDPLLNGGIGLGLGLLIGLVYAARRYRRAHEDLSEEQVESSLEAPVIGVLPRTEEARGSSVLIEPRRDPTDPYRLLGLDVMGIVPAAPTRVLMVASVSPGNQRVVTAAKLSAAIASSGTRVSLISSDAREDNLSQILGRGSAPGLTETLMRRISLDDTLQRVAPRLLFLPVGAHVADLPALVGAPAMARLLAELGQGSDLVVVDVSPVLGHADAIAVAPMVDGVLLVVDGQRDTVDDLIRVRRQLEQVGSSLIGVVLLGKLTDGTGLVDRIRSKLFHRIAA